jgi:hypothetical protein
MKHNRDLQFEQQPDYEYLQSILKALANKEGIDLEEKTFDWVVKAQQPLREIPSFRAEDENEENKEELKEPQPKVD